MKKLTLSFIFIALFATVALAQNVGLVIQPQLETSITRKGFFVETSLLGRFGVYSDFKIGKLHNTYLSKDIYLDKDFSQINLGLSFRVMEDFKIIGTNSVLNKETLYIKTGGNYTHKFNSRSVKSTQQVGLMFTKSYLSVLLGYETDKRITFGLGFNLN